MNPEDIKFVCNMVGGLGIGAAVAVVVTFALLRFYLPGYLGQKAKNLADKEDIEAITKLVEDIKLQNGVLIEDRKAHNQLRFAAVDRRLVAHQEAFTHWSKLLQIANAGNLMPQGDIDGIEKSAREWWYSNAIYLEPDVRGRFDVAIATAARLPSILKLKVQDGVTESTLKALETAQTVVRDLGSAIIRAVELPTLTGKEPSPFAYIDAKLPALTGKLTGK